MSEYELVLYGDPVLRRRAEPVDEIDDNLRALVDEMFRVMFEEQGIGLAAPQVGVSKRMFIIDIPSENEDEEDEGMQLVAINPEVVSKSGSDTDEEGCLSIPGVREKVTRPDTVVMSYIDLDGDECEVEASGLFARALQHEYDHLEGILFIDKISSIRRSLLKRHLARIESGDVPERDGVVTVNVIFMGSPEFAVPSLDAVHASSHTILEVVTQPDRPQGRGRGVRPSAVGARAAELGYPVEKPLKFGTKSFVAHLAERAPDAFVVVAYGKLLKQRHLDIPPFGCVNVHPSLLPRHRGAVPIQSTLLAGDDVTGVTTMRMDIGLDTGDMLLQRAVPVEASDNAGRLHDRLAELGAELLVDTLDGLEAETITPLPQEDAQATVCQRLTKDDGRLDWSKDARSLYRHVRAMNPWPSAFTARGDTRVTVRRAEVWDVMPTSHAPGSVVALDRERGPVIACGEGSLLLTELQPAGRKAMMGDAFLRGTDVAVGEGWG